MKTAILTALGLLVAAAFGGTLYIASGAYDIAANVQHTQAVYSLLEVTAHRSVRLRARAIEPPPLDTPALLARGAACFRDQCVQCHGGPGVAQAPIGRSMQPLPGPLVDATRRWNPSELYWITRNGIKMSGMPAWQHRLADEDLWAIVAFMQRLPRLTAPEFAAINRGDARCESDELPEAPPRPADAARGPDALTQYACNACHRIPGVTGSDVHVGPPLAGIGARATIAGRVPNTPAAMVRWIRDPKSVEPATTMPDMQVNEGDARDIAAYLATLR